MSPTRPTLRVRPRSAIADAELARAACTELPGIGRPSLRGRGRGPRAVLGAIRSIGRPIEPDRVIVMPLATVPAAMRRR